MSQSCCISQKPDERAEPIGTALSLLASFDINVKRYYLYWSGLGICRRQSDSQHRQVVRKSFSYIRDKMEKR